MSSEPQVRPVEPADWGSLATRFLDASYRQTRAYAVAAAGRLGASSQPVAVVAGSEVLGLADVRIKRLPVIGGGVAFISGGPMARRGTSEDLDHLGACLTALRRHFVESGGLVLRVQGGLGPVEWNEAACDRFAAAGFVPSSAAARYRTLLVDLRPPLVTIRARLAQKWRNGLNQAERHGLTIRTGTDLALFATFCELFQPFVSRKGFDVELDAEFYRGVQLELPESERLHVSIAEKDGKAVAGMVSSHLGDTCVYLLGASSDEAHRLKASYLLQWQTLESARDRGIQSYDLGGIDPDGNPGVFHFKSGLGGVEIVAPGPYQCVPRGLRGAAVLAAEQIYRSLKRRTGRRA